MKELFQNIENICLSGGAEGADLQWGMCAGLMGHNVIHWSFNGHKSKAPDSELVRLDDKQLKEANASIKAAALIVKKQVPVKKWVLNLIQRNYYQVAWSDSVYVVSEIKDNIVQGGSGWAVYMYLNRITELDFIPNCYVFCQVHNSWYKWNNGIFEVIELPPKPSGIWAGIGSRDLKQNGKDAIRYLTNFVKPT